MLIDKNASGTQEKVLSILKEMPVGRVLDAPCGEGALLEKIRDTFEVYGIDIDEEYFKLKEVPLKKLI